MKKKSKFFKGVLASLLLFGCCSTNLEARYNVVANFFLPNGMQVICIDKKGLPIVTFSVYYKCGSVNEIPSKSGVAHYLEHMAFSDQCMQFLESIGAERNAFTSFRCICFFEVASTDHLDTICEYESKRMKNFEIDPKKFITEKGAILEERSMVCDNNPAGQCSEAFFANCFNRALGGIHIIGWKHEISATEQQDLFDFHDKWMVPNNAIAIIVGDIDLSQIESLMDKHFASIKPRPLSTLNDERKRPEHKKKIELKSTKVGTSAGCDYFYFVPFSVKSDFRKTVALKLATNVLNQSTCFVQKTLKETLNKAAAVSFNYGVGAFQYDLFSFSALCSSKNNLEDCEDLWKYLKNKLIAKGISKEALDAEKRRIAMSLAYRDEDVMKMSYNIWEKTAEGYPMNQILEFDEVIQSITVEECNAVLREVLGYQEIAVIRLLPKDQDREKDQKND